MTPKNKSGTLKIETFRKLQFDFNNDLHPSVSSKLSPLDVSIFEDHEGPSLGVVSSTVEILSNLFLIKRTLYGHAKYSFFLNLHKKFLLRGSKAPPLGDHF